MDKLIDIINPTGVFLLTLIAFLSTFKYESSWLYCLAIFFISAGIFSLSNLKVSKISKALSFIYSIVLISIGLAISILISKSAFIVFILITIFGIGYASSKLFFKSSIYFVFYSAIFSTIIILPEISIERILSSISFLFVMLSFFMYRDITLSLSDKNKTKMNLISSKIGIFKTRNIGRAFSIVSILFIVIYNMISSNLFSSQIIFGLSILILMVAMFTKSKISEKILLIVMALIILSTMI